MEVQLEHHENEPILAPGSFKHHCRVCKRGFGCGRALGGHKRAHGIAAAGDQEVDVEADDDVPGRRMYALRANPSRPKTCQACDNCGMEFSSWKAFLDHHGKCSSGGDHGNDSNEDEDGDSVLSSPKCHDGEIDQDGGRVGGGGWSKLGKRSSRSRMTVAKPADSGSEEEVLANWLIMLSTSSSSATAAEKVEPAEEGDGQEEEEEEERGKSKDAGDQEKRTTASKAAFECKGCKKVFASHQALGGHRASHKTVKGCFAARLDDDGGDGIPPSPRKQDDGNGGDSNNHKAKSSDTAPPTPKRKHKMHECSICRRTFSSGQALGGHKRCHWITPAGTLDTATSPAFMSNNINATHLHDSFFLQLRSDSIPMVVSRSSAPLDLNMPAATEDESSVPQIRYYNGIVGCKDDDDDGGQVEVERRMKLAKLGDLRAAMENVGADASPWLQMGIGSTATNVVVGADT